MTISTRVVWMDGKLVPWEEATVHVLAHGLHYGSGVFEGIRAYPAESGAAVFRLTDHMRRLHASARAYRIPLEWSVDQLVIAAKEVVRANALDGCYLRPIAFYGGESIGLNPRGAPVHTAVVAFPLGAYLGADGLERGVRVRVSSWRRFDHQALFPDAKGAGQYLNSVLAKQEALLAGCDEAVMLAGDGFVAEGSGENLFLVTGETVRTPDRATGILCGITRDTVMTLLADDGVAVEECRVPRSDLYRADEAFFTGTAAEVTPIREIDDRVVGDGSPGPITRRVQERYRAAVHGELPAYRHWLEPV